MVKNADYYDNYWDAVGKDLWRWEQEIKDQEKEKQNGNIDGRTNNNQSAGVHGKTPVLLKGGIANSMPVIL